MAQEVDSPQTFMADTAEQDEWEMQEPEPGVKFDISKDGGLFKEIIKPGTGWEKPEKGDKVTVHYTGTLEDGTKFDSSRDRGDPFTFTLGQGSVISGWDVGVATFKKGEVSKLTIRSDYGYGDTGSPPTIPGGATLIFEVELLSWKSVKDIAGDGGVMKTVVIEGKGWDTPKNIDEVNVKISAKVQGASTPFYVSPSEEGEEYILADGGFCKGVDMAVCHMKKGETVRLIVKPEYGFGSEGSSSFSSEAPPNATLEIELTLVGWKKVEHVTPDGSIMRKILLDNDDYKKPNPGSKVICAYIGRLLPEGTIFDEKKEDDPLVFITDEEEAPCEGFELAISKMKKGEKDLVTIAPQYAFGAAGSVTVPANSHVSYEITLLDFEKAKDSWEMETPEKISSAVAIKEKGNVAFKAGKLERATKLWERAKTFVEFEENFTSDEKKASKDLTKSCNLNLAAAYLKLNKPTEARSAAEKVLETDSFNVKALYRRAQAYMATSDWVEAEQDIKKGLGVEPDNTDFKLLLKRLRQQAAASAKKEAALWAGSFTKMAATSKAAPAANNEAPADAAAAAAAATEGP